uniref:Uncharacterized protein n=1 Tax=Physcomitrium patens TaxID=3218 RepID=A0A7I4ERM7_PHYPA
MCVRIELHHFSDVLWSEDFCCLFSFLVVIGGWERVVLVAVLCAAVELRNFGKLRLEVLFCFFVPSFPMCGLWRFATSRCAV